MSVLHELSFGKLIQLDKDLVEVIINHEVEMDLSMVAEYHEWLINHLTPPFMALINRINQYTYTFEAQQMLGNLSQFRAVAVVSYSSATNISVRSVAQLPRENQWNMELFSNRDKALEWLISHRD